MTIAENQQLALNSRFMTWTELLIEAENTGNAYEQDFENEITYFQFADDSVSVFCGIDQTLTIYNSKTMQLY